MHFLHKERDRVSDSSELSFGHRHLRPLQCDHLDVESLTLLIELSSVETSEQSHVDNHLGSLFQGIHGYYRPVIKPIVDHLCFETLVERSSLSLLFPQAV